MTLTPHETIILAKSLLQKKDQKSRFTARQLLFLNSPLSKLVELYLYNNERQPQKLDDFPMMVPIYDNLPKKLLLKCSRKTLKSTLISNMMVLNALRYNDYHMGYISPNEATTKKFSHDYLSARFASPPIMKIISGLTKNDVFLKEVADTKSSIMLSYADTDPTRLRGPSLHACYLDEVSCMDFDILPVIAETMAILRVRRETFAGTPMTTDNTIHRLWKTANQMEWAMRCGCKHWNTLTEDNDPMKMIQKKGFSCSKCGNILNSKNGMWVDFNPGEHELQGYHLAQPLIPFYNTLPSEWEEIYNKVYNRNYGPLKVFNEVFGLSYDVGAKPITEEKLKSLCLLGEMKTIHLRRARYYREIFGSVDWGVSGVTSRTVFALAGLREDGIIEVFYVKVFKDTDYEAQIKEIAEWCKQYRPFLSVDSGPDPIRGRMLGTLYDESRTQLVAYRDSVFTQHTDVPAGAISWHQCRWVLHRSDVMGFTIDLLKKDQILFPRWEDCSEAMQDILTVFTEIKEDALKAKIFYRHKEPDDFMHVLTWITCHAHLSMGNVFFLGPSSSNTDDIGD